ncbi:RING-type E3 ubiquitin transferase [Malassezia sp. CBS 17886]|nr:RING-type E3 ubiquitin transferase [Malassezia sp. CBS 17886]
MSSMLPVAVLVQTRVLAVYGAASLVALAGVLTKAAYEHPNYYSAATWVSNSNGCLLILLNSMCYTMLVCGRVLQHILLGRLHRSEQEQLVDSMWYPFFDTFMTLTLFRLDFDLRYIALAAVLLFLQFFHRLCANRINMIGQLPSLPRFFHMRMVALLSFLVACDTFLLTAVTVLTLRDIGPDGIMVYFTVDSFLPFVNVCALVSKYALARYEQGIADAWHEKSRYVFFIDFVSDLLMFAAYPVCYGAVVYGYIPVTRRFSVPLNVTRNFLFLGYTLVVKTRELLRYRAATRDMEHRYPSLTEQELRHLADRTCIICREELTVDLDAASARDRLNATPKRLVCGHVFHFRCLYSWLERQQSCPTCRRSVLTSDGDPVHRDRTPAPPDPPREAVNLSAVLRRRMHAAGGEETPSTASPPLSSQRQGAAAPASSSAASRPAAGASARLSPTSPPAYGDMARALLSDPLLDPSSVPTVQARDALEAREATRAAALRRFAAPMRDAPLVPAFNPASVTDMDEEEAHGTPTTPRSSRARLSERLSQLEETQSAMAQAIAQLRTALDGSAEGEAGEFAAKGLEGHDAAMSKGKARATDAPPRGEV